MARLSAFDTCVLYLALKSHFTTKYDFIKYNGKIKLSKQSFEIRKDHYSFHKLNRLYSDTELKEFLIANFVYRAEETKWVGSLFEPAAKEAYDRYLRELQSLTYTFSTDLDKLDLHTTFKGQNPEILQLFYGNHISIFTMIILDDMIQYSVKYNKELQNDILWSEIGNKLQKFRPFFQYDRKKFKDILKDRL